MTSTTIRYRTTKKTALQVHEIMCQRFPEELAVAQGIGVPRGYFESAAVLPGTKLDDYLFAYEDALDFPRVLAALEAYPPTPGIARDAHSYPKG